MVDTILTCTMGATVKDAVHLCAMTDDLTPTVGAFWRKRVDGTFKAVEDMRLTIQAHFKAFIVFVSANFTRAEVAIASE
jgi:hypothetical protein